MSRAPETAPNADRRIRMGYIQRREDRPKPWLARYRGPDGKHHSKAFRRKVDAERWLREEEGKSDRGEWVDPAAGKLRYAGWSETWLAGLHSVKPKTLAGYESLLRSRVVPEFGNIELRRISTALVRSWVASMVEDGLSAARIRQALQVLHASLDVAVEDGLIARNPTDRVKAPRVEKRRQLFLTAFELGRLADEAAPYDTLVWFLGWSGLRWGEAVALRAGRVDARRIRVEESATEIGGKLEWGRPKTNEARTVIVPNLVASRLAPLVEGKQPEELVFTARNGGPLRHSNFTKGYWSPAVERSEAPEGLMIHDLRDTAASLAISAGASIKAVQRMLGHASASMTLDTYGSLFEEDLEALADRLDEKYG